MAYLVSLLGIVLVFFLPLTLSEDCSRDDSDPTCVCKTSRGIIDLTPLSRNASARFDGFSDPNDQTYSYNPCSTFTDGGCKNAFICGRGPLDDHGEEVVIADGGEALFGKADGTFAINYNSSNGLVHSVEVLLFCEQGHSSRAVAIGDTNDAGDYQFELHSCYACPGGCDGEEVAGLIGLVLIILVILAVLVYFAVGALIKKVHYKATGADLIPNRDFWVSLPLLIMDGCLFVTSPCRRNDGYSKM